MKTRKFNLYISGLRSASAYLGTMLPKDIAGHKLSTIVEYAPAPDTMAISVVIKNEFAFKLPVLELPIIGEEIVVPTQAPRYVASQFRKQIKQFKDIVNKLNEAKALLNGGNDLHWSDIVEADSPFLKKLGDVHPTEGWAKTIDLNEEYGELDFQIVNSVDGKAINSSGMKHCIPPLPESALPTDLVIPEPLHSSGKTMATEALLAEKGLKLVTLKNRTPSTDINIFPQGTGLNEVLQEGFKIGQLNTIVAPTSITQRNEAWFNHQVVGRLKAKPECGDNINVDGVSHYVGRALEDDEYICTTDSGDKVIVRRVDGEFKHVGGIERDVATRTRTIVYFDGTTKTL